MGYYAKNGSKDSNNIDNALAGENGVYKVVWLYFYEKYMYRKKDWKKQSKSPHEGLSLISQVFNNTD